MKKYCEGVNARMSRIHEIASIVFHSLVGSGLRLCVRYAVNATVDLHLHQKY